MLSMLSAVALTLIGAGLVWLNKPAHSQSWQGEQAAYFMVGLAGACLGFMSLILPPQPSTLGLMLEQLCLYAALPLLASVEFSKLIKRDFSRQVWGRILLAIAAVFELCRRNNVLDEMLLITLGIGAVVFILAAPKKPLGLGWLQAGIWGSLAALSLTAALTLPTTAVCALALLSAFHPKDFSATSSAQ